MRPDASLKRATPSWIPARLRLRGCACGCRVDSMQQPLAVCCPGWPIGATLPFSIPRRVRPSPCGGTGQPPLRVGSGEALEVPTAYVAGYEAARQHDPELAEAYVRHTMVGDPLADAVVRDLSALDPAELHQTLAQALDNPDAPQTDAPRFPHRFRRVLHDRTGLVRRRHRPDGLARLSAKLRHRSRGPGGRQHRRGILHSDQQVVPDPGTGHQLGCAAPQAERDAAGRAVPPGWNGARGGTDGGSRSAFDWCTRSPDT